MSAPPEEWMLWAMRIRNSVRAQINEAIEALPSRYPQLDNDTADTESFQERIVNLNTTITTYTSASANCRQTREVESATASFDQRLTNESKKWQAVTLPIAGQLEQINDSSSHFSQFQEATQKTIADQQHELSRIAVQLASLTRKVDMKEQGSMGKCNAYVGLLWCWLLITTLVSINFFLRSNHSHR